METVFARLIKVLVAGLVIMITYYNKPIFTAAFPNGLSVPDFPTRVVTAVEDLVPYWCFVDLEHEWSVCLELDLAAFCVSR